MSNGSKKTSKSVTRRRNTLGSLQGPSADKASAAGKPNSNENAAAPPPPELSSAPLGKRPASVSFSSTYASNATAGNKAIVRTPSATEQPSAASTKPDLTAVGATRVEDVQDREKVRLGGNVAEASDGRPRTGRAAPPPPKAISPRKESISPSAEGIIRVADFESKIKAASSGIFKEKAATQNKLRDELITHLTDYHNGIAKIKQTLTIENAARVNKGTVLKALNAELSEVEKSIAANQISLNEIQKALTDNRNLAFNERKPEHNAELNNKNEELAIKEKALADLITQKAQLEPNIKAAEDFINKSLADERTSILNQSKDLTGYIGKINAAAFALNDTFIIKSDTLRQLTESLGEANIIKDLRAAQMEASGGIPFDQQLIKVPRIKDKESANIVYVVETNGALGNHDNHVGYAKMATAKGEPSNVNTNNLGIQKEGPKELNGKLLEHPNMIARSVLSYEVDKLLGIGVTSYETFTRNVDGRLMGISGQVGGLQCEVKNSPNSGIPRETYKLATTQRMLSDLQIMDAITGQTDRHIGNIFIDPATGIVSSIDQDQAHPSDNDFLRPAADNPKFISGTTQLGGQFRKEGNKLIYTQKLIDAGTAEKILKITPEQLRSTLKKQVGDESLPDKSIEAEIERFNAVKARIIELKNQKPSGLVTTWNESTFRLLVEGRNGVAREPEYAETGELYVQPRFNNYVALGAYTVAGKVAKNDFKVE